jgi:pre-mRNA-splicing helicase BRR2
VNQKVLDILKNATDERDVETQLVLLLGFNQFDIIKLLRSNRQMIYYCTLLASAQSADEREQIEEKMREDAQLAALLSAFERETEEKDLVREERDRRAAARRSKIASGVGGEGEGPMDVDAEKKRRDATDTQWNPSEVLNLDEIRFAHGDS